MYVFSGFPQKNAASSLIEHHACQVDKPIFPRGTALDIMLTPPDVWNFTHYPKYSRAQAKNTDPGREAMMPCDVIFLGVPDKLAATGRVAAVLHGTQYREVQAGSQGSALVSEGILGDM